MCYEWGDAGWCKQDLPETVNEELSWDIVENLFSQYGKRHPSFILIGGEPLLYSNFDKLARALKEHRCFAITCTNGTLLHRYKDVSADNPYLTYLVSLDGLRRENDRIRGRGVYDRVTKNIKLIKSLRNPPYGKNLGWKYLFWEQMNGFLSPVSRNALGFAPPDHVRFININLPAQHEYQDLSNVEGDINSVLLVCGFWGQARDSRL
jgi:pyruvate-formate lyase-activating enzyme